MQCLEAPRKNQTEECICDQRKLTMKTHRKTLDSLGYKILELLKQLQQNYCEQSYKRLPKENCYPAAYYI
jgi:hypothetical protein